MAAVRSPAPPSFHPLEGGELPHGVSWASDMGIHEETYADDETAAAVTVAVVAAAIADDEAGAADDSKNDDLEEKTPRVLRMWAEEPLDRGWGLGWDRDRALSWDRCRGRP